MRHKIQFEINAKDMFQIAQNYHDYMLGDVEQDVVNRVFDFLEKYNDVETSGDGLFAFICRLSAIEYCDVTVKVVVDEESPIRIIQVNTFGDYWGLDISIEPDGVFVFCGLSYLQANGLSN